MATKSFLRDFEETFVRPQDPRLSAVTKLTLNFNIVYFEGIPAAGSADTFIPSMKELPIPLGAVVKSSKDVAFMSKMMMMFVYESHKLEGANASPRRCNCCGKTGIETFVCIQKADSPDSAAALMDGLTVFIDPAYPVCLDPQCNHQLHSYMQKKKGYDFDKDLLEHCRYVLCRKVDPVPGQFSKCGRCHVCCYCSKECQTKDCKFCCS